MKRYDHPTKCPFCHHVSSRRRDLKKHVKNRHGKSYKFFRYPQNFDSLTFIIPTLSHQSMSLTVQRMQHLTCTFNKKLNPFPPFSTFHQTHQVIANCPQTSPHMRSQQIPHHLCRRTPKIGCKMVQATYHQLPHLSLNLPPEQSSRYQLPKQ